MNAIKYILPLLIFLLSSAVYADSSSDFAPDIPAQNESTLFPLVGPDDASYRFMRLLYGSVADTMVVGIQDLPPAPSESDSLIGAMNSIWIKAVITVTAFLLIINIVSIFIRLNKKKIPLNIKYAKSSVRGMSAWFTLFSWGDHSLVQLILFYAISIAIALANQINSAAVEYLLSGNSTTGQPPHTYHTEIAYFSELASCVKSVNLAYKETVMRIKSDTIEVASDTGLEIQTTWRAEGNFKDFSSIVDHFSPDSKDWVPVSTCGKVTSNISDSVILSRNFIEHQNLDLLSINDRSNIVRQINSAHLEGIDNLLSTLNKISSDVIDVQSTRYTTNSDISDILWIKSSFESYINSIRSAQLSILESNGHIEYDQVKNRISESGAMMAGLNYYRLMTINSELQSTITPEFTYTSPNYSRLPLDVSKQTAKMTALSSQIIAKTLGELSETQNLQTENLTASLLVNATYEDDVDLDFISRTYDTLEEFASDFSNRLFLVITNKLFMEDTNPIKAFQDLGRELVFAGEVTLVAMTILEAKTYTGAKTFDVVPFVSGALEAISTLASKLPRHHCYY